MLCALLVGRVSARRSVCACYTSDTRVCVHSFVFDRFVGLSVSPRGENVLRIGGSNREAVAEAANSVRRSILYALKPKSKT